MLYVYSKSVRTTHDEIDLELVVTATAPLTDRIRAITVARVGGALPAWAPGAHIDLTLGDQVRQYSLCCDPADNTSWTVVVQRDEQSRGGSTYAHDQLEVGTVLTARGPRNHFPLVDAAAYLFIAGGIGVTPLMSMIANVAGRRLPWRLVYGGRRRSAMAFADQLVDQYGDHVDVVPEDDLGLLDIRGLLQGLDHADTAIYCCGPEGLVGAVEDMHALTGRGLLHVERFSPRERADPPSTTTFEVEARRSGTTVTVDEDTSILDALTGAGVKVLSSCREGICGTCELFVLDGEPEHRDSILTEAERHASETMFPCVSRSLSPRLVLDA